MINLSLTNSIKISIRFYNDREVRAVKVERMRKFTNFAI